MSVIVTRPGREAQRWAEELQRHGIAAVPLPLIEIGPAPDAGAVRLAWERLGQFRAVMFVSGNAVDHFFQARPGRVKDWPSGPACAVRAWAPGPGTCQALLQAGVPQQSIDSPGSEAGQFDSESLWQQVDGQLGPGDRVLIVRGADASGQAAGRDWLAAQLAQQGVQVETVIAYVRRPPTWSAEQLALARRGAQAGSLWLFSSSEAIGHLRSLLPRQDWKQAAAVATHPRIAQAAREAGFGSVRLSRPALTDVVASIESAR